jgi:hypothetical protein
MILGWEIDTNKGGVRRWRPRFKARYEYSTLESLL